MLPDLEDFLLNLQTNNYSPETVYNYERDLAVFDQFLTESGTSFDQTDKQAIARYKAYLASRDRKTPKRLKEQEKMLVSHSINRMLSSLRSYLKFLIEMDKPTPIPPEAVKLPKT